MLLLLSVLEEERDLLPLLGSFLSLQLLFCSSQISGSRQQQQQLCHHQRHQPHQHHASVRWLCGSVDIVRQCCCCLLSIEYRIVIAFFLLTFFSSCHSRRRKFSFIPSRSVPSKLVPSSRFVVSPSSPLFFPSSSFFLRCLLPPCSGSADLSQLGSMVASGVASGGRLVGAVASSVWNKKLNWWGGSGGTSPGSSTPPGQ